MVVFLGVVFLAVPEVGVILPLPFVSDSLAVLALVLVVLVVLVDFVAVAVEALAVLRVAAAVLLPLGSVLLGNPGLLMADYHDVCAHGQIGFRRI